MFLAFKYLKYVTGFHKSFCDRFNVSTEIKPTSFHLYCTILNANTVEGTESVRFDRYPLPGNRILSGGIWWGNKKLTLRYNIYRLTCSKIKQYRLTSGKIRQCRMTSSKIMQ
jgi:hypothetical protein